MMKEACAKICGSAYECQETLYLTGTANFKSDTCELFNWMAPEKTCCVKHDLYTEGKIEILPENLCNNDPGTGCSDRCSLEKIKQKCESECGYDSNDATYLMWKKTESLQTNRTESCKVCVEKTTGSYCGCTPCVFCGTRVSYNWDYDCGGEASTPEGGNEQ